MIAHMYYDGLHVIDSVQYAIALDDSNQGIESLTTWSGSLVNDVVNGNQASGTYYPSGSSYNFSMLFNAPNEQAIGEVISNSWSLILFSDGEPLIEKTFLKEHTVTCAYDPNDKQVFPGGFSEEHYILPETPLEYLIRFQNTGNAPATNVTVRDTISPHLDLNTFELASNTHDIEVTIDPISRGVEFHFPNINLPDSTCCFDESIGMFSYRIQPLADLPFETRIENTAHIFFDNNPAIVTNTTWSTIYECTNALADFQLVDMELCEGQEVEAEGTADLVTDYAWSLNQAQSDEPEFSVGDLPAGDYQVELNASNPLCDASQTQDVTVHPLPDASFSYNDAQDAEITNPDPSVSYQWYYNGELIPDAIGSTYDIAEAETANGEYHVVATSAEGCETVANSMSFTYLRVEEYGELLTALYPNPVKDMLHLEWSKADIGNIQIRDLSGRLVDNFQVTGTRSNIDVSSLNAGMYQIIWTNGSVMNRASFVKE